MKSVQFAEYGGPEVLKLVEVEKPHTEPGQIRVKVNAAGVNGIDWKIRAGYMREMRPLELPAGTGMDAAGVVDEVGEGVTGVAVGDAVFGLGSATFAEFAVLSSWLKKPAELSFEEAAGYPLVVETAVRILDQAGVRAGETLLISGASGGVGSAAVQLARARGVTVIGTAGERNQDYLKSLGAIPAVYGDGLVERIRALAPNRIDAALDIAGSGVIPELVELTGDPTRVVTIADFGEHPEGVKVSAVPMDATPALEEAARLFTEGKFQMPIEKVYRLEAAAQAQTDSAAEHTTGKLVVTLV